MKLRLSFGVFCAFFIASVASAGPIIDPVGDVFNPPGPDISQVTGSASGGNVSFTVKFASSISPPSALAADSILGFIDLDTDKNAGTGGNAPWGGNQTGGNSWINFAVANGFLPGPPIALGSEYFIDLFSEFGHPGSVDIFNTSSNLIVGTVAITFGADSFTVSIPLAMLGNPSNPAFNYGAYIGDLSLFSGDRAPNGAAGATVDVVINEIPEPTSLAICGLLSLGVAGYCWRRKKPVVA